MIFLKKYRLSLYCIFTWLIPAIIAFALYFSYGFIPNNDITTICKISNYIWSPYKTCKYSCQCDENICVPCDRGQCYDPNSLCYTNCSDVSILYEYLYEKESYDYKELFKQNVTLYNYEYVKIELDNNYQIGKTIICYISNDSKIYFYNQKQSYIIITIYFSVYILLIVANLNLSNTTIQPNQYPFPILQSCDPLCNIGNIIQQGPPPQCTQTVCIIDNVNINQVNSQGDTTLNQACGGTYGSGGTCYIDETTINEINAQGDININQNCGQCFSFDPNNPENTQPILCGGSSPTNGLWEQILNWIEDNKLTVIGVSIFIFLIVLAIIIFILYKKYKK